MWVTFYCHEHACGSIILFPSCVCVCVNEDIIIIIQSRQSRVYVCVCVFVEDCTTSLLRGATLSHSHAWVPGLFSSMRVVGVEWLCVITYVIHMLLSDAPVSQGP